MRFKWIGQSDDGGEVRLKRLEEVLPRAAHASDAWLEAHREELGTAVFLDTETTGLDVKRDLILEVALKSVLFHRPSGQLLVETGTYCALQDPGRPLNAKIRQITGLDDAALAGKRIDWSEVERRLTQADIIVAHNASFDRPLVDRAVPASASKVWGCSRVQVDWYGKGFGTEKLDLLCIYHGFFGQAHRAANDVNSLARLMACADPAHGRPYFHELLSNAAKPLTRVVAAGSPFETKDLLKERGYAWDLTGKAWHRTIPNEALVEEQAWLSSQVYKGKFLGRLHPLKPHDTFKAP